MIELNANVARFHFEPAHLAPETFQVAGFTGREEISRPYRFDLNLVSQDPIVDFAEVINRPATFTMLRSIVRVPGLSPGGVPIPFLVPVHGIITHFEQAGRTADHVAYRAVLVPRLQRLALSFRSRVFQRRSVVEIVTHLLEEAGLAPKADFRFDLAAPSVYTPRDYCVQFQETDLDFMHRLLEFEGIAYFFEQEGVEKERLVFTDRQRTFKPIEPGSTLPYHQGAGLVDKKIEKVHDLICREQVVTGRVLVKDFNEETPDVDLRAESQLNGDMPGTQYEYGLHFENIDEGKRLARVRNQEIEARRRVLDGKSDCMGFRSGFLFTLAKHYRPDLNEAYLLTCVEHRGEQKKAMGLLDEAGGDGRGNEQERGLLYRNTFTCIPASVPYRPPRRTPIPQVPGVMTARMEARDPGDKYAYLDEEGRYRARMHFDLRDTGHIPPAEATKPIRMNQPYSGRNYGVHFPNHDGTEMVWSCVNGDPDRPMALGTVPNANTVSPATSANEPQSVIRTEGRNELTFDDTENAENIYMHATKNHTVDVINNESISVGSVQRISVGAYQVTSVKGATWHAEPQKGDQHILTQNDQVLLAGNDQFVHAQHNQEVVVDGDRSTTIIMGNDTLDLHYGNRTMNVMEGDRTVTLMVGTDTLQVDAGDRVVNLAVGNDHRNILSGNRTVTLNAGSDTLTAAGMDARIERRAPSGEYIVKANNTVIECIGGITLTCGASTIEMSPGRIRIDSPKVEINCKEAFP